jgi:large subunit ribosomal protein L4
MACRVNALVSRLRATRCSAFAAPLKAAAVFSPSIRYQSSEAAAAPQVDASALPANLRFDKHTKAMLEEEKALEARAQAPTGSFLLSWLLLPAPHCRHSSIFHVAAGPIVVPVFRVDWDSKGIPTLVPSTSTPSLTLSSHVFGAPLRKDIVHRVLVWQQKCNRMTMYKTQDRAEVAGGGKKPWKQKGTGRARVGSTRSPLWRGGGVAHGPVFRDWSIQLNKGIRRLGVRVALSAKAADGRLIVLEDFAFSTGKTKSLAAFVKAVAPSGTNAPHNPVAIVVESNPSPELKRSVINIPRVCALPAAAANVKDIVGADVLVTTVSAVKALTERLEQL